MSQIVDAHVAYCNAISDLSRDKTQLLHRIKRLEEAGDELLYDNDNMENINRWHKAKEAKL